MAEFFATYLFVLVVVNAIFSAIVAYVANQKGRSPWAFFFLSFFFTFFVGILVILAIPGREKNQSFELNDSVRLSAGDKEVKCPFCAEWIKSEAKVCRYCGREIQDEIRKILAKQELSEQALVKQNAEFEEHLRNEEALRKEELSKYRKSAKFKIQLVLFAALIIGVFSFLTWLSAQPTASSSQATEYYKPLNADSLSKYWQGTLKSCKFDMENPWITKSGNMAWVSRNTDVKQEDGNWGITIVTESNGVRTVHLSAHSLSSDPLDCVTQSLFGEKLSATDEFGKSFGSGYEAKEYQNKVLNVRSLDISWTPGS